MSELAVMGEPTRRPVPKFEATTQSANNSALLSRPNSSHPLSLPRMNARPLDAGTTLGSLDERPVSEAAARQQLDRILQSPVFIQSERLSRFLRFIVEHVLDGTQAYLKEYVIGSEVYQRKPPYHPGQDSIVRTEARRLRGKLKEYYEVEGKDDPISFYLRPGSYVPFLRHKDVPVARPKAVATILSILPSKAATIAVAIFPFHDISQSALSSSCARAIPDELAYTLMRIDGCKVVSPASMAHLNAQVHDAAAEMSRVGAQFAYEGSVRHDGTQIRVTGSIVDAAGFQLWTKRIDAEADPQKLFLVEEQIAAALSAGFDLLSVQSRQPRLV